MIHKSGKTVIKGEEFWLISEKELDRIRGLIDGEKSGFVKISEIRPVYREVGKRDTIEMSFRLKYSLGLPDLKQFRPGDLVQIRKINNNEEEESF